MSVVFSPIFVVDTKIILGSNFETSLIKAHYPANSGDVES